MAETPDDAQKTEAPTQRRLEEAREEGRLASSRDVASFALLGLAALLCGFAGTGGGSALTTSLRAWLAGAHLRPGDAGAVAHRLLATAEAVAVTLALPLGGALLAAVLAALVQHGPVWTPKALALKPQRLSPAAGLKRLLSSQGVMELLRALLKLAAVTGVALAVGATMLRPIIGATGLRAPALARLLLDVNGRLLMAIAIATAAMAALDFLWQRHSLMRQLRMSRQEVLDEHKHSEGDPVIKQRLRALRTARARQRMMAEVPKATVVITNPTHFAVALRYDPAEAPVPVLVAKGTDRVAARIRDTARAHGVPLVENPPLARVLHVSVELGRPIAQAHYQAVAEVIGYVLRLRRQGGGIPPPGA
jgi:flagellar biosynthetic protein FlhB